MWRRKNPPSRKIRACKTFNITRWQNPSRIPEAQSFRFLPTISLQLCDVLKRWNREHIWLNLRQNYACNTYFLHIRQSLLLPLLAMLSQVVMSCVRVLWFLLNLLDRRLTSSIPRSSTTTTFCILHFLRVGRAHPSAAAMRVCSAYGRALRTAGWRLQNDDTFFWEEARFRGNHRVS